MNPLDRSHSLPRWALRTFTTLFLITSGMFCFAPRATAAGACCRIVSVNLKTGTVQAEENATKREFTFTVTNKMLLASLKVGQSVYANFSNRQVSVDGKSACCTILSKVSSAVASQSPQSAKVPVPCCVVSAINVGAGIVAAEERATGKGFLFKVVNSARLESLKDGQAVYANFRTGQVSFDGRTVAGIITTDSSNGSNQAAGLLRPSIVNTPAGAAAATSPDFSIAFAPNSPTSAISGTKVIYTVNIGQLEGFNGDVKLSAKIEGVQSLLISPPSVWLGCPTAVAGNLRSGKSNCASSAAARLIVPVPSVIPGAASAVPALAIEVDATYSRPNVLEGRPNSSSRIRHSAYITLTPAVLPTVSMSCGGTSNPLSADRCAKSANGAFTLGALTCGASVTITGTTFPAGSSDWLVVYLPASRANCTTPVLAVSIASSPVASIVFDVLTSPGGPAIYTSYGTNTSAALNEFVAGLGLVYDPLPQGWYYIGIHGAQASTMGTWKLTITG